jgi:hypothetical protein
MLGVVVGARMASRREMTKLAIEQGERLRARRQEAYAEFYSIVFGIATAALEDYEPGVMKEVAAEHFHDSLRLRATIGLLGPESISRQAEGVLATLSALDNAAKDPTSHDEIPSIADDVRRQVDVLLQAMQKVVTDSAAPSVAALPSRMRGLRRAGRPA